MQSNGVYVSTYRPTEGYGYPQGWEAESAESTASSSSTEIQQNAWDQSAEQSDMTDQRLPILPPVYPLLLQTTSSSTTSQWDLSEFPSNRRKRIEPTVSSDSHRSSGPYLPINEVFAHLSSPSPSSYSTLPHPQFLNFEQANTAPQKRQRSDTHSNEDVVTANTLLELCSTISSASSSSSSQTENSSLLNQANSTIDVVSTIPSQASSFPIFSDYLPSSIQLMNFKGDRKIKNGKVIDINDKVIVSLSIKYMFNLKISSDDLSQCSLRLNARIVRIAQADSLHFTFTTIASNNFSDSEINKKIVLSDNDKIEIDCPKSLSGEYESSIEFHPRSTSKYVKKSPIIELVFELVDKYGERRTTTMRLNVVSRRTFYNLLAAEKSKAFHLIK